MPITFLFISLFTQPSSAVEYLAFTNKENPSLEEMRWNIPPADWNYKDEYFIKGKYFKIKYEMQYIEKREDGQQVRSFNIYSDPNMKSPILLGVSASESLYQDNKEICRAESNIENKYSEKYYECRDGGCAIYSKPGRKKNIVSIQDLTLEIRKSTSEPCPIAVDYVHVQHFTKPDEGSFSLFKYKNISSDKKSVEITINNKPAYLDIRKCKWNTDEPSKSCEVVDFPKTKYEENLLALENTRKNKNHTNLNRAIALLGPCLVSKNVKCVEKYMTREGETDTKFVETKINADIFAELEACLDYRNLLAHQLASRGLKKACIFNESIEDKPIRGVTFIEALSINSRHLPADD